MHGAQGSVGVAAIMAFFFLQQLFPHSLTAVVFTPAVGIILVTLPFFSLQAFCPHKSYGEKKKQVSCGKIWSASWSYVYVMHIERVLGRCWNRGKHHVNLACVVTLPSFECTAVCLAGVLRQWEREKSRKTDMKLIGEITHEMMVISNETCWVNFQA